MNHPLKDTPPAKHRRRSLLVFTAVGIVDPDLCAVAGAAGVRVDALDQPERVNQCILGFLGKDDGSAEGLEY